MIGAKEMGNFNWIADKDDFEKLENFSMEEFTCQCGCEETRMNYRFLRKLQALRSEVGYLTVNSGYRCCDHPLEKNKSGGPGSHSIGHAVDINHGRNYYKLGAIVSAAKRLGFKGLGISEDFVHLDDDHPNRDRKEFVTWGY